MESFNVWNDTFEQISLELSSIRKLLVISEPLLGKIKNRNPDDIELMALAGILHSFYTGFENIFKRIAKEIDSDFSKSDSWHVDLLENMAKATEKRSSILSQDTVRKLRFYLGFRHVFRSHYSYDLNWDKMRTLILESEEILYTVEQALNNFMKRYA